MQSKAVVHHKRKATWEYYVSKPAGALPANSSSSPSDHLNLTLTQQTLYALYSDNTIEYSGIKLFLVHVLPKRCLMHPGDLVDSLSWIFARVKQASEVPSPQKLVNCRRFPTSLTFGLGRNCNVQTTSLSPTCAYAPQNY